MPKNRKPFVPHFKQALSAKQIREEAQSVVRRLLEESPIPVVDVPVELQHCCDTVLLRLSIDTRWKHGGIKTSRGLRDVLHAIANCVKDEARKLRIYSELDVAVNEELDSWCQRVADSLLASREEVDSEKAHEDAGVGQEPSALEPSASKETAALSPSQSRGERAKNFKADHGCTYKAIYTATDVHRQDFDRWRKNELPDSSVMSKRIEDVLLGSGRLQTRKLKNSLSSRSAPPLSC